MNIGELQNRANEIAAKRYHAKAKLASYAETHIGEMESSPEWLDLLDDYELLDREWRDRTRLVWTERRRREGEV